MAFTRTDLKIIIVGAVVLVVAGATSTAAVSFDAKNARNADKVDGRHAVAAATSPANAKGRLVAMDKTGHLPAKFVPKAGDAATLGGKPAASYLQACSIGTLQARATIDGPGVLIEATPGPDQPFYSYGVDNSWSCTGEQILVRHWQGQTTGRFEVVVGQTLRGNTVGWAGPGNSAIPQVSATAPGVVVSSHGANQCALFGPPYVLCYTVETTNLTGTPIDGGFTITIS